MDWFCEWLGRIVRDQTKGLVGHRFCVWFGKQWFSMWMCYCLRVATAAGRLRFTPSHMLHHGRPVEPCIAFAETDLSDSLSDCGAFGYLSFLKYVIPRLYFGDFPEIPHRLSGWRFAGDLFLPYYYYYYYHHHNHHHHHHYLLYAGYLYMYSWDKPCP